MERAISTHLLVNHRLTIAMLDRVRAAGIPTVEIFCARQHLDYTNRAQIGELGHWFRDADLRLRSLHSPMYSDDVWGRSGPNSIVNIAEPVKARRIAAVDEVKRALEIAETIPFRYLVQHLGVSGDEYDEHKLEAAFSSLEELSVFAKQRGVDILLENTPNALASAERLLSFLAQTHLNLNFCFDTGHAHMNEGVGAAFQLMQDRIRSVHVHDNDGQSDLHLFPGLHPAGSIDWNSAMKLLRSRAEQYPLLLELREDAEIHNPLEAVLQVFDFLEGQPTDDER